MCMISLCHGTLVSASASALALQGVALALAWALESVALLTSLITIRYLFSGVFFIAGHCSVRPTDKDTRAHYYYNYTPDCFVTWVLNKNVASIERKKRRVRPDLLYLHAVFTSERLLFLRCRLTKTFFNDYQSNRPVILNSYSRASPKWNLHLDKKTRKIGFDYYSALLKTIIFIRTPWNASKQSPRILEQAWQLATICSNNYGTVTILPQIHNVGNRNTYWSIALRSDADHRLILCRRMRTVPSLRKLKQLEQYFSLIIANKATPPRYPAELRCHAQIRPRFIVCLRPKLMCVS